jgi:hypothetical protein
MAEEAAQGVRLRPDEPGAVVHILVPFCSMMAVLETLVGHVSLLRTRELRRSTDQRQGRLGRLLDFA